MIKRSDIEDSRAKYLETEESVILIKLEDCIDKMLISCGPGVEIAFTNILEHAMEEAVTKDIVPLFSYTKEAPIAFSLSLMKKIKKIYTENGWKVTSATDERGVSHHLLLRFE